MAANPYEIATPTELIYAHLRPDVNAGAVMLMSEDIARIRLGQEGCTFLNGASQAYGVYRAIFHVANTVYANNHMANWDGTYDVKAYTFPAGSWIYGEFINPKLTSGTVYCYRGEER